RFDTSQFDRTEQIDTCCTGSLSGRVRSSFPPTAMIPTTLTTDALLVRAAELRAEGMVWERIAGELGRHPGELIILVANNYRLFRRYLNFARREIVEESLTAAV